MRGTEFLFCVDERHVERSGRVREGRDEEAGACVVLAVWPLAGRTSAVASQACRVKSLECVACAVCGAQDRTVVGAGIQTMRYDMIVGLVSFVVQVKHRLWRYKSD